MNLVIDIGNTLTHVGFFGGRGLVYEFKIPTNSRISNEKIYKKLARFSKTVQSYGISSVVPNKDGFWNRFVTKYFKHMPLFISGKVELPIKIRIKNAKTLGADRICNAVAGYNLFKGKSNVIVIGLGTANTFDVILRNGDFEGGIIAPGIETSSKALHFYTGKLPLLRQTQFIFPRKVTGRDTTQAIQSGLMYSASKAIDGMISQIEKDYHRKFNVVLTGGFAGIVHRKLSHKTKLEKNLVLKGINDILKYNDSSYD